MTLPKAYFELQLEFAQKVSEILGRPLEDILTEYTSFYKTFQIKDWDFNPQDPVWQDFLVKFREADDKAQTVLDFYLVRKDIPDNQRRFGFFSYDYEAKENYIQIHFKNIGEPGPRPLSQERMSARMAELTEMFKDIKTNYPQVDSVSGFSWLYNLESYRRLFPPEYIKTAKLVLGWFKTGALWHQFLDKEFNLRADRSNQFKVCMQTKNSIQELEECFPFRILEPECAIEFFYKFYGI